MAYKERVDYLKAQAQEKNAPCLKLVLLTFTVKNGVDLWERFSHLRDSIQKLLKRRNNQKLGHTKLVTEMIKFCGGVFAYEFKRGSGGTGWHPHIHMLALISENEFCDAANLKDEWLLLTGDSSVVNLVYCESDLAFLEVFAYALKFSTMEHPDRWQASQLLRGERLISSFGELRGIDISDDVADDILITDEPYVDLLFQWHHDRYADAFSLFSSKTVQKAA